MLELNKIYNLNALDGLKSLPNESIDCVLTSPPYWGLRDYGLHPTKWNDGTECVLGLERTFQEYLSHLSELFEQIRRILKPTGTLWVNLGDTFCGDWRNYAPHLKDDPNAKDSRSRRDRYRDNAFNPTIRPPATFPQSVGRKSLCLIPERFAVSMVDRGWILRNRVVWHKPNAMPTSAKDRLTTTWEYLYLFTKRQKYFFDLDAIREPYKVTTLRRYRTENSKGLANTLKGVNPGDLWKIAPRGIPTGHYAVYPEELCERPIKAGCPSQVCAKCGAPRLILSPKKTLRPFNIRIRDVQTGKIKRPGWSASATELKTYNEANYQSTSKERTVFSCPCNAGFESGIVLDPFIGSGTTALVARNLGRNYLGFELNPNYVRIAECRLEGNVTKRAA